MEQTIKDGVVTFTAKDLDTGAIAKKESKAVGSIFVANKSYSKNGYSTSMSREMWVNRSFQIKTITPQEVQLTYPKLKPQIFLFSNRNLMLLTILKP